MAQPRNLTAVFASGGLNRRLGFQSQPLFTSPDAQNVWPDDVATGRGRGGRRPGMRKAITTELPDAIRMKAVVNLATETGFIEQLVASAGGQLYRHNAADGTYELVSTALRIATDRLVLATPFEQKLIIADWGIATSGQTLKVLSTDNEIVFDKLDDGTDGAVDAGGLAFTSASIGDFETAGVVAGTHLVRVVSGGGTPGPYKIASVSGTTITLLSSPGTSLSGLTFEINVDQEEAGVNADDFRLLVRPAGNGTAGQYDLDAVDDDRITLTSSPGAVSTDQIHYQTHRAPKVWDLLDDSVTLLTASVGEAPLGCNIVTTFNNRAVWGGDINFPNMWYASEVLDETNYDYGQPNAGSAVSATEYRGGQIGNPITSMIPHNEDCLLVGTNDNFYVMRGDPADGGYLTRISSVVGPIAPNAWCRTDRDEVVFLTRYGVYAMPAGCGSTPQPISQGTLPNDLQNVMASAGTSEDERLAVLMAYDQTNGAVHLYTTRENLDVGFISDPSLLIDDDGYTLLDVPAGVTNEWEVALDGDPNIYRIDRVTGTTGRLIDAIPSPPYSGAGSWSKPVVRAYWLDWRRATPEGNRPIWKMFLPAAYPTAICDYRPFSTSRASSVLIGDLFGRSFVFDRDSIDDFGVDFQAFIVIGPIKVSGDSGHESLIVDGRVIAALGQGNFRWTVHSGPTAEKSMPGLASLDETWQSDEFEASEYSEFLNITGHAMTIKVYDLDEPASWSFEEFVITIHPRGLIR